MKKLLNKIIARNETKKRDVTALEICTEKECPDGGYGWIICIAAAMCQFIIMGIHNNFGILYTYFMRDLKADPADTTWVGSIAFGVTFFGGPIASNLCERFGCRLIAAIGGLIGVLGFLMTSFANSVYVIYFTYSVVWGFGSSLSYATTTFVIGQYFDRNLALANGIVTGGSGIGAIAMGPFYHLVLSNLGWKIMLRILSGFAFLMFVSALLYRPLPAKYKRAHIGRKERGKLFDLSVWKIKPFVFWVVSMSLLFFGYFVPFIHLPNFAEILGVPESKASLLIGYLSIASTLSRVLFGLVLNHPRINRFYVLQVCFVMMAVTCMLCPLVQDYTGLILYAVSFGTFDGCFVLLIAITTSDVVGPNLLPQGLGSLYGVISLPIICGAPLAAYIFEKTGSYQDAFLVAGAAIAAGSCTLPFTRLFMPDLETGRERKEICEETPEQEKAVHVSVITNEFAEGQRNSCV